MNIIEGENRIIGVLKFISPKYSKDFENDYLYFNSLKTFQKIEHEDIGDELEGVISDKWVDINSSEDSIEMYFQRLDDPYAQVNKVNLKEVIFKNTPNINKDFKICCFSIIRESDLVKMDDGIYRLSQKFINEINGILDNRNIYITIDFKKIKNRLLKYFSENDIFFKGDIVEYFNEKHPLFYKIENKEELTFEDIVKVSFCKSNKYANQKEYRILAYKLKGNKIKIIGLYNEFFQLKGLEQLAIKFYTEEEYKDMLSD